MKTLVAFLTVMGLAGCSSHSPEPWQTSWTLRSERAYAERREALAADFYRTGRAKSAQQAFTLATAQIDREKAAEAAAAKKWARKKEATEAFAKNLADAKRWESGK